MTNYNYTITKCGNRITRNGFIDAKRQYLTDLVLSPETALPKFKKSLLNYIPGDLDPDSIELQNIILHCEMRELTYAIQNLYYYDTKGLLKTILSKLVGISKLINNFYEPLIEFYAFCIYDILILNQWNLRQIEDILNAFDLAKSVDVCLMYDLLYYTYKHRHDGNPLDAIILELPSRHICQNVITNDIELMKLINEVYSFVLENDIIW